MVIPGGFEILQCALSLSLCLCARLLLRALVFLKSRSCERWRGLDMVVVVLVVVVVVVMC